MRLGLGLGLSLRRRVEPDDDDARSPGALHPRQRQGADRSRNFQEGQQGSNAQQGFVDARGGRERQAPPQVGEQIGEQVGDSVPVPRRIFAEPREELPGIEPVRMFMPPAAAQTDPKIQRSRAATAKEMDRLLSALSNPASRGSFDHVLKRLAARASRLTVAGLSQYDELQSITAERLAMNSLNSTRLAGLHA